MSCLGLLWDFSFRNRSLRFGRDEGRNGLAMRMSKNKSLLRVLFFRILLFWLGHLLGRCICRLSGLLLLYKSKRPLKRQIQRPSRWPSQKSNILKNKTLKRDLFLLIRIARPFLPSSRPKRRDLLRKLKSHSKPKQDISLYSKAKKIN